MTQMLRITARWDGFMGAPGYSVFHFRDFGSGGGENPFEEEAQSAANRVWSFFEAMKVYLNTTTKVAILAEVPVIESTTGTIEQFLTIEPPVATAGTSPAANAFAGPAGAVVTWRTNVVRKGRRIRGRTFLVPLAVNAYQTDGTLGPTVLNVLRTAATTLATAPASPDLGIWARPSSKGAGDGVWAACTGATVPDMVAVLRSRRD